MKILSFITRLWQFVFKKRKLKKETVCIYAECDFSSLDFNVKNISFSLGSTHFFIRTFCVLFFKYQLHYLGKINKYPIKRKEQVFPKHTILCTNIKGNKTNSWYKSLTYYFEYKPEGWDKEFWVYKI